MSPEVKEVYDALLAPDAEMINEANVAFTDLALKWRDEGKLGPKSMAALLIVVLKKYVDAKLPAESLPMLVSVAWGVVRTLKWKDLG